MKRKAKKKSKQIFKRWYKSAYADGIAIFIIIFAGLGLYLNFHSSAATYHVVSPVGNYNYCMDDYHSGKGAAGAPNKVDIWACNGTQAQNWSYNSNHTITNFGQCLDVYKAGKTNGSKVDLFPCNGGTNQLWTTTAKNTIVNTGGGGGGGGGGGAYKYQICWTLPLQVHICNWVPFVVDAFVSSRHNPLPVFTIVFLAVVVQSWLVPPLQGNKSTLEPFVLPALYTSRHCPKLVIV